MIRLERRVPNVRLGRLHDGQIMSVDLAHLLVGRKALIVGVPGAFTPVCTEKHVPDLVANAPALRAAGFSRLICLAPNDPFVLALWKERLDPEDRIEFYSDGNFAFSKAMGLTEDLSALFLGRRTKRFLMTLTDGVIDKLSVEENSLNLTCTRPGLYGAIELAA